MPARSSVDHWGRLHYIASHMSYLAEVLGVSVILVPPEGREIDSTSYGPGQSAEVLLVTPELSAAELQLVERMMGALQIGRYAIVPAPRAQQSGIILGQVAAQALHRDAEAGQWLRILDGEYLIIHSARQMHSGTVEAIQAHKKESWNWLQNFKTRWLELNDQKK